MPNDIRSFVREGTVEVLGLDRRILATIRATLLRPAHVARAHLEGRGQGYVQPVKLFLVLAGAYMLAATWLKPFSFAAVADGAGSRYPLTRVVYGVDGPGELHRLFAERGLTDAEANERFEERMNATTPLASALAVVPLALVLGALWSGRPWREHATILLVAWNAVWLVSFAVLPLVRVAPSVFVISDLIATYAYLGLALFTFYRSGSLLAWSWRFVAFLSAEVVVSNLVSAAVTAAVLATLFLP